MPKNRSPTLKSNDVDLGSSWLADDFHVCGRGKNSPLLTTMNDHDVFDSHFSPSPPRAAISPEGKSGFDATCTFVPHRGSLRRIHNTAPPRPRSSSSASDDGSTASKASPRNATTSVSLSFQYVIPIVVSPSLPSRAPQGSPQLPQQMHELKFERHEYEFISRLFAILDTESRGTIGRTPIRDFVRLRCPVFRRRDRALTRKQRLEQDSGVVRNEDRESPTFDEVWNAVVSCSVITASSSTMTPDSDVELGIEGWMVFCRFIALTQYQEAKSRFSARHLQQTMRHKSGGRGSEVVLVNVPPPDPPEPLTAVELAEYERHCKSSIALPELDLDHSLVSAHDMNSESCMSRSIAGKVEISVFGSGKGPALFSSSSSTSSNDDGENIEFIVTYISSVDAASIVVRRSFSDMKWLHDTFTSHKSAGGTLCGRILPPFPTRAGNGLFSDYDEGSHSAGVVVESGRAAMAVASAGVGMIKSMAKSFLGGSTSYRKDRGAGGSGGSKFAMLGKGIRSSLRPAQGGKKVSEISSSKARQLERYLNYYLEHPALSTSFPLNTTLKASQSGLDSAKRVLNEYSKVFDRQKRLENIAQLESEKSSSYLLSLLPAGGSSSTQQPNLSWVRTAAQAAMALKLHGILETTGMPSASAKLQHASLPHLKKSSQGDEDGCDVGPSSKAVKSSSKSVCNSDGLDVDAQYFENGVVSVESALGVEGDHAGDGDGYDMLPSPLPLPERSVLCAGSINDSEARNVVMPDIMATRNVVDDPDASAGDAPRFYYGSRRIGQSDGIDGSAAVLGDMSVDDDIDKLREIIGAVDNTLGRCLAASTLISEKQRKREIMHRSIVRSLDSWEGMRGEIVSQRGLLSGVTALEQGNESSEKSFTALNDDLSWQASLASAAVSAAEDVRSAVRTARTATGAKIAAEAAAVTAQKTCDEGKFSTANEARAAQTRASIAHSHAIHAAVIEHEALAAKRRAAMALAHDVKCWNVHRKRELLHLCRATAKTQRQACRQTVEAWTHLRDGLIGSSLVSVTDEKRGEKHPQGGNSHPQGGNSHPQGGNSENDGRMCHNMDSSSVPFADGEGEFRRKDGSDKSPSFILPTTGSEFTDGSLPAPTQDPVDHAVSLASSPKAFESQHEVSSLRHGSLDPASNPSNTSTFSKLSIHTVTEESTTVTAENGRKTTKNEGVGDTEVARSEDLAFGQYIQGGRKEEKCTGTDDVRVDENDVLTASMQSLVDGLMNWGGQYDSQEDLSLPSGMAVSIALEESGIMGNTETKSEGK